MKCDRNDVLNNFLKSEKLAELISLSDDEIQDFNYMSESNSLLMEALKKLIYAYCSEDSDVTVLRKINNMINEKSNGVNHDN